MCQEPKKLAELGVRNFCGDFNARKLLLEIKIPRIVVNITISYIFCTLVFFFSRNFVVIFFLLAFCNSAKLRFPSLSAPLPSFFIESFSFPVLCLRDTPPSKWILFFCRARNWHARAPSSVLLSPTDLGCGKWCNPRSHTKHFIRKRNDNLIWEEIV